MNTSSAPSPGSALNVISVTAGDVSRLPYSELEDAQTDDFRDSASLAVVLGRTSGARRRFRECGASTVQSVAGTLMLSEGSFAAHPARNCAAGGGSDAMRRPPPVLRQASSSRAIGAACDESRTTTRSRSLSQHRGRRLELAQSVCCAHARIHLAFLRCPKYGPAHLSFPPQKRRP